eukprot:Lankesteria_metandrocarpae@DN9757_c0_g1_i1.p1
MADGHTSLLESTNNRNLGLGNEDITHFLPDIRDAKLWLVKCSKNGIERQLCAQITKKFLEWSRVGRDFPILSAYACDSLRGYIYVEAENCFKIRESLIGMNYLMLGRSFNIKMVPLKEMPAVFHMGSK